MLHNNIPGATKKVTPKISCFLSNCLEFQLLPGGFIFQQDGVPVHMTRITQYWLQVTCPEFIRKDQWPPNRPDLTPMDYYVGGVMLEAYHKLCPKPKSTTEFKKHCSDL